MDNTGAKGENIRGSKEQMLRAPESYEATQNVEAPAEQSGDMRANNNAETRRMQEELNQFFEDRKAKQAASAAEEEAAPKELAPAVEEVKDIPIKPDAKSLNKALGQKILGIMKRDEKEPNQLSEDFNALRKYYLDKTKKDGLSINGGKK